jgi:hypothetical protein
MLRALERERDVNIAAALAATGAVRAIRLTCVAVATAFG